MPNREKTETTISRRALSAKVCGAVDEDLERFRRQEVEISGNISKTGSDEGTS